MFQQLLNCLGPCEGRLSVKAVFSKSKYYNSYFNKCNSTCYYKIQLTMPCTLIGF